MGTAFILVKHQAQSVAIGIGSGFQIGSDCVAIGANAGGNPAGNSICLNATGSGLNPVHQGLYIDPVRNQAPVSTDILYYNTTTKEVYYDTIIETGLASTLLATVKPDVMVEITIIIQDHLCSEFLRLFR